MKDLKISTEKKHRISPHLYMQFMEPLGTADASVDAAWDFFENEWYSEVIDIVRSLSPSMVRFGGCFASYYRWKEAIGRYEDRIPMVNTCWGGLYHNRVGTHEVIDFCRKVNADPLIVVNMESDGNMPWAYPKNGSVRFGTDEEAKEWVAYCNDPVHPLREKNGSAEPFRVKHWQIGNETSYIPHQYGSDKAVEVTKRFADKMREADPSITLIGWGDKSKTDDTWCRKMSAVDEIDMVAFHHHFGSGLPDSPLIGTEYRKDPEKTWEHLMHAYKSLEKHIALMRSECGNKRLALTEGHYTLKGRNRNEVLSSWGAGVSYARCLNVIMRNSDVLDIATMADFFGNVWQVNAVMIPAPLRFGHYGSVYLQPVGAVMRLFRKYQGDYAVDVGNCGSLDTVASMTDNKLYLHIANTAMKDSETVRLDLGGKEISSVTMSYIASDPTVEITQANLDVFDPITVALDPKEPIVIPAAAVAAIEITLQ